MTRSNHGVDEFGAASPSDRVADDLRTAIFAGDLVPDQRLIEADISERFHATRAAVRSALHTLAGEGLVERQPNRGARVRAISLTDAIEIAEVRVALECLCARRAAHYVEDGDIDGLLELRRQIADAVEDGRLLEYGELNRALDRRVRDLSRNRTAAELLERLLAQSARHQFRLAFEPGRAAVSSLEHIEIIDAIVARDPDRAEAATRAHLEGVIEALRSRASR